MCTLTCAEEPAEHRHGYHPARGLHLVDDDKNIWWEVPIRGLQAKKGGEATLVACFCFWAKVRVPALGRGKGVCQTRGAHRCHVGMQRLIWHPDQILVFRHVRDCLRFMQLMCHLQTLPLLRAVCCMQIVSSILGTRWGLYPPDLRRRQRSLRWLVPAFGELSLSDGSMRGPNRPGTS